MIFTSCTNCDHGFSVYLDERYLDFMKESKAMFTCHECEKCGHVNFVEHRRVGGETISENEFIKRGGIREP